MGHIFEIEQGACVRIIQIWYYSAAYDIAARMAVIISFCHPVDFDSHCKKKKNAGDVSKGINAPEINQLFAMNVFIFRM